MPKRDGREEETVEVLELANLKLVSNSEEFIKFLDEDELKLIVVEYFITGCSSCTQMRPIFNRIANKFPNAQFLEVNTDECQDLAKTQGIIEMPTFVLYRKGKPISQVKGAHPNDLEHKVRHYYFEDSEEIPKVEDIVSYEENDISNYIDHKRSECLNVLDTIQFHDFMNHKTRLISDCDEQLILSYGFNQDLELHAIKIKAPESNGPKSLKMFINLLASLDFDNASSMKSVQEIMLTPSDLKGENVVDLSRVKFQKVKSLHIFIAENMSGTERTEIESLSIYGSPVSKAKGIAGRTSEVVYLD